MYSSLPLYRSVIFYMGLGAMMIAVAVLTGWQFNITHLKTLVPGLTPMNPITAITFIFAGTWIILYTRRLSRLRDLLAVIISIVGLLHFVTYFFPAPQLRMDYWLYRDVILNSGIPNKIAPNTALNFLLCGSAMLLTGRGGYAFQLLRQIMLFFSFFLTYTSLLGYIFELQPAYRFGGLTPMALMTTIAFLFIILGLIFSDTRYGLSKTFASPLSGGRLMRRIVPLVLLVPPLINYLSLIGQRRDLYTIEFGTQLSTFIFTCILLLFITLYAMMSNRRQKEEQEQSQRIASLLGSINEAVLETDSEGKVTYVNGSFEKIMGYSAEEVAGLSALELIIPGKDKSRFQERLERRKKGIEESYVNELVDKNGEKKQMAITAKPLYDNEGKFKSILVTMRDITEELRQLQDIKTFTDFAAHDLKSPLVNMTMLVDTIKESELSPEQSQVVNMMDESAIKMSKLVDELLQFSRLGAAELKKEWVDVASLVKEVLSGIDAPLHRVEVSPLPSIEANEPAVRQLFTNLISNAVKYSSKAEKPAVTISSYEKDDLVYFRIADNGIGIEPRFLSQLFQPFKRFTSQFKGNGLGLAIVKRIIEKHGGQIEANLNEGAGLRFDFTFTPEKRVLVK